MRTLFSNIENVVLFNRNLLIQNKYSTKSLGLWKEEFNNKLRHTIEEHWRPRLKKYCYNANDNRPKFYVLSMFPYPSGNLHMGHVRIYAISDTIARYHRMLGKNVFHPMGWDAFGLPAENAAIERKESPEKWTYQNISTMKKQLTGLECCFDWESELATCHPCYYKFTQYIFLKLYEAGLVYQKEAIVNWDPVDETVLADEQVDEKGLSWRSGAKVEKRFLKQWFIRTTKFAKSLADGLNDLKIDDWRDIIKMQKNWIGECDGVVFDFQLVSERIKPGTPLTVWTKRPEHISKSKFIVVACGSLVDKLCDGEGDRKLDCHAVNPVNNEHLPIYVSSSFEFDEGSDTRLGIPDAFEVDNLFARSVGMPVDENIAFLEDDELRRMEVCKEALAKNYGGYFTSSILKDWLISRQRYWGTPIPLVHCEKCGVQPVGYEDLPVSLPTDLQVTGSKTSMLKLATEWINTTCPKCKGVAQRETDTMDTFVDSSWYYLRFLDPRNNVVPFNKELAASRYPVDIYVGGKEHATLHLYYARFMAHFLHSIGWTTEKEPFQRMLVQGMVMGKTYRIKGTGQYIKEDQVVRKDKKTVLEKETGNPVIEQWEKMSKSKLNGVDPSEMLVKYGIDTTRLLTLADVVPTSNRHWNEQTFPGVIKWQHRLWLTIRDFIEARNKCNSIQKSANFEQQEEFVWDSRNYYLKGIIFSYSTTHQLSTAISKMQGLTANLRKSSVDVLAFSGEYERALVLLPIALAPIAPHFASELWAGIQEAPNRINKIPHEINWGVPIVQHPWPDVDSHYNLDLDFLVNGAQKSSIKIPRKDLEVMTEAEATKLALCDPAVKHLVADYVVKGTSFKLMPAYKANINLFVDIPKKDKKKIIVEEEKCERRL